MYRPGQINNPLPNLIANIQNLAQVDRSLQKSSRLKREALKMLGEYFIQSFMPEQNGFISLLGYLQHNDRLLKQLKH